MKKKIKEFFDKKKLRETFLRKDRLESALNNSLIIVLGLSITLLMTLYIDAIPKKLDVGSVATKDIKADQNYEIVDEKSTAKLREEATASILPVYDFDPTIESEGMEKIRGAFESARKFIEENRSDPRKKYLSSDLETQLKQAFQSAIGSPPSDEHYKLIRRLGFSPALENTLGSLLHEVMQYPIIHNTKELEPLAEKGFVIRKVVPEGNPPEEISHDKKIASSLDDAKKKIASIRLRSVEQSMNLEFMDRGTFSGLKEIAMGLVNANMNYNGLETDSRKHKAEANIKNIIIKIKRGESIIRSGDRFEPWHLIVVGGIHKERLKTNRFLKMFGIFLFVNLVLLIVYYFAAKYIRKFKPSRKDLIFMGVSLILFLAVLRIGGFIGLTVRDALPFSIDNNTIYYVIPIAAGAMMVRFILNSEIALVFAVILSLFSGIFLENNLELTIYYLISGVFAAHVIAHVDKRSTILLCGAYAGMVNAVTILSLNLITSISGGISASLIAINVFSGLLGGLFIAMTVLVFTPICEILFNYTTDIKLLELANMSHPLLKKMVVESPGTYHHSQLVGILSEAGAQAISANPLLSRVASYYHDIGKMKKPQYFVENQEGGPNPHDKLAPSMSALIVGAHVKDGLEMAEEYGLPEKIIDMIPQHQGTKLIAYFYNKAKKLEDPGMTKVHEKDFRYPGPRPQTREAGVIMLADSVEAGVRSLPEKTPSKIQATVEKLVNHHFVDEQLDECDLTLKDLHKIAEAFVKILVGIYHQRVEYPEGALVGEGEVRPLPNMKKTQHDSVDSKQTSAKSNIAQLFRKKDQKNPPSSESAS